MKWVIFLALVAFSSAFVYNYEGYGIQRTIWVDGDREITILTGNFGKIIFRVPKDDPKSIEIFIRIDFTSKEIIRINENQQITKHIKLVFGNEMKQMFSDTPRSEKSEAKTSPTQLVNRQMNILINIFKKYTGNVGEAQVYQLLKEIKQAIKRGELPQVIYDVVSKLQVSPIRSSTSDEQNVPPQIPEMEDEENYLKDDETKLQNLEGDETKQKFEDIDQKVKLAQQLQAGQQRQWIHSIFESKNRQQIAQSDNQSIQDFPKNASKTFSGHQDDETRQMALQTFIQELQIEIYQEQLKAQQLQIQQQFLNGQILQYKLHLQLAKYQGLHPSQLRNLYESFEQVKKQIDTLIERQLRIQHTVRARQDVLIKQYEKIRDDLRRDNN